MYQFKLNNPNRGSIFIGIIIIFSLTIGNVFASSIDSVQLLKISPQDQRAIIKTPDGKMQIIKPGDVIRDGGSRVPSAETRVIEIANDRVVFVEKTGKESETVIIRLEDGKQRVERTKKVAEKQPSLYAVKTHEQKTQSKEPLKGKKKKGKKGKSGDEVKKSSVVN